MNIHVKQRSSGQHRTTQHSANRTATARRGVEKPIFPQLVKKSPARYGTRRLIPPLNPIHRPIKSSSSPHCFLNMYFNIILPTFFKTFLSFSPKPKLFTHYSSLIRATFPAHLILLNLMIRIIFMTQQTK